MASPPPSAVKRFFTSPESRYGDILQKDGIATATHLKTADTHALVKVTTVFGLVTDFHCCFVVGSYISKTETTSRPRPRLT